MRQPFVDARELGKMTIQEIKDFATKTDILLMKNRQFERPFLRVPEEQNILIPLSEGGIVFDKHRLAIIEDLKRKDFVTMLLLPQPSSIGLRGFEEYWKANKNSVEPDKICIDEPLPMFRPEPKEEIGIHQQIIKLAEKFRDLGDNINPQKDVTEWEIPEIKGREAMLHLCNSIDKHFKSKEPKNKPKKPVKVSGFKLQIQKLLNNKK